MYSNKQHIRIPDLKMLFSEYLERYDDLESEIDDPIAQQLETALDNTNNVSFKIIHPLLLKGWRMPSMKFRTDFPVSPIGMDVETNAETGEPRLFGFWFPETETNAAYYHALPYPTLTEFFKIVRSVSELGQNASFITWGKLDIQCIIRLFDPVEIERARISRGLSGNIKNGKIVGTPPVLRYVKIKRDQPVPFYIAHYIPGRSLKLGYIEAEREHTIWVFNGSQFYPGTIAQTAKGLGLQWTDYPKASHIIDWFRFATDKAYQTIVYESNKQDARIVAELAINLQDRFFEAFGAYPTLLVSTGSLTDAAIGKMLSDNKEDYQSNSWAWLEHNVWKHNSTPTAITKASTLLAEAFSAGYVDQFAVGYFSSVCTADIAGAYPHKIRQLPDLRYSRIILGKKKIDVECAVTEIEQSGEIVETAILHGLVHIPTSLKFHPITIKSYNRENYRPTGTFYAAYTLEERRFCQKYGATFENEEYVLIVLSQYVRAPIAQVSERLGEMRDRLIAEMKKETDPDRKKVLDGQQYLVKVVDNSGYGKTVMTTEVVEDINGSPQITGYVAGDRFNQLYGSLITARTRIQIASACMQIVANGGTPIMTMTDSIYWYGKPEHLPSDMVSTVKKSGFFEAVETVEDFYLLKTGQYEYRKGLKWTYKVRGLNIDFDVLNGMTSFYRSHIIKHCAELPAYTHPKSIEIEMQTRKLVTIGSHDLQNLGAILEGKTMMKPFVMSSKQAERYLVQWKKALHDHVWLQTPHIDETSSEKSSLQYPLAYLTDLYQEGVYASVERRIRKMKTYNQKKNLRHDIEKMTYVTRATQNTGLKPPDGRAYRLRWDILEKHYGISRYDLILDVLQKEAQLELSL